MEIKPIRTDADHDEALHEIERLWNAKKGTAEADQRDVLVPLVEAYENSRYPMPPPDPLDAIRFRLEQLDLDIKALVGVIGARGRVYEVMRGDRPLSLNMIRRVHEKFGIPAEILIRPTGKGSSSEAA